MPLQGMTNLEKHIENIAFGLPSVVAINRFPTDTEAELALVKEKCEKLGASVALSENLGKGRRGGIELAEKVVRAAEKESSFVYLYKPSMSPKEKIETIATVVYGAEGVKYTDQAEGPCPDPRPRQGRPPHLHSEAQYSLSDNPSGAAGGFFVAFGRSVFPPGRFPRGHHGIGHDHARPAEEARRPVHRHRRKGPDLGLF
ncbi:hypothetical protein MASR1M66_04260 [Aminivibrio sp.]